VAAQRAPTSGVDGGRGGRAHERQALPGAGAAGVGSSWTGAAGASSSGADAGGRRVLEAGTVAAVGRDLAAAAPRGQDGGRGRWRPGRAAAGGGWGGRQQGRGGAKENGTRASENE
jgi:hypothetical protein